MKDSRYHAFNILTKFYKKNDRLKSVRDFYYKNHNLSQNELNRSLVLSNEVVRWSRRLDFWIDSKLSKPIRKLNPSIHIILKLGYYEVVMDNGVPNHAAVNSWVELTKLIMGKKFSGLVNALLRKAIQINPENKEDSQSFGEWYSFPDWMVDNWIIQFGKKEALLLCKYLNIQPFTDVRLNTYKSKSELILNKIDLMDIKWERSPNSENFLRIKSGLGKLIKSEVFNSGMINIQDRASGAIVELLDPKEGETILDICAAPGTKTNYIYERMNRKGQLFASDISLERLNKGQKRAASLGLQIKWLNKDATIDKFPMADRILIDAPCTGTGVIGRKPDIRWRRELTDSKSMKDIQLKILNHMVKYVKPKGVIVYATCSLEKDENWDVVSTFLKLNKNFSLKPVKETVPKQWINKNQCLETFPPRDNVDGMFAAYLQKI